MAFVGYKFKFELHAGHSNLSNSTKDIHYHNFTITIYIKNNRFHNPVSFDDFETYIIEWLRPYQNQNLSDTDIFYSSDTTLESIGDHFYNILKEKTIAIGLELVRLDIYENPIRTYSVSDRLLDSDVNELSVLPLMNLAENTELPKDEYFKEKEASSVNLQQEMNEDSLQKEPIEVLKDKKTVSRGVKSIKLLFALGFLALAAFAVMYYIKVSGIYPRGSDTLCHLYRADLVRSSIKNGIYYPLYDHMWYNGVEIMRYWAPLPLYILAFLQEILHGNVIDAYVLFTGVTLFFGGAGWLLFGWKYNRIGLATFIGVAYFFLPENMRLIILDGNMPRVTINILLPYLLFFIWSFIEEKRWHYLIYIIIITCLIGFCHAAIATMVLLSVILYVMIHSIVNKRNGYHRLLLIAMVISFAIIGIWLFPALNGGAVSRGDSTNQVMKYFFDNVLHALNPTKRWNGDLEVFYYGLSLFIIAALGSVLGNKKSIPGFITALLIFLGTSKSMYHIFIHLPLSQFFWMIRFIPISIAFIMMSILLWTRLKKWFVVLICIFMILDMIPSYQYIYVDKQYRVDDVNEAYTKKADSLFINQAKEVTSQRMALFDLSRYGAFAPYYIAGVEPKTQYTFGAGWEGAAISTNIVQLNSALTNGNYLYLFDRSLELGNDTILIRVDYLKNKEYDMNELTAAGKRLGYELYASGNNSLVFHKKIDYGFGVITTYKNIAIGESANELALLFPDFKEGYSTNLSDYSFEELKGYEKIYLSGFTYEDKKAAEKLLTNLANQGVKIYIDMNKIPVDVKTNRFELLDVNTQAVSFQYSFPYLNYENITYKPKTFVIEEEEQSTDNIPKWNTVYLNGIKNVKGSCKLNNEELVFAGTGKNENIIFLGLNLVYHTQSSDDTEVNQLLTDIFEEETLNLPNRQLVPIDISYHKNKIIINSNYDNVNTTLAFMDIFHSKQQLKKDNNLLVVNKGTTVIRIKYPYFNEGMILSTVGLISFFVFLAASRRYLKKKREDSN